MLRSSAGQRENCNRRLQQQAGLPSSQRSIDTGQAAATGARGRWGDGPSDVSPSAPRRFACPAEGRGTAGVVRGGCAPPGLSQSPAEPSPGQIPFVAPKSGLGSVTAPICWLGCYPNKIDDLI